MENWARDSPSMLRLWCSLSLDTLSPRKTGRESYKSSSSTASFMISGGLCSASQTRFTRLSARALDPSPAARSPATSRSSWQLGVATTGLKAQLQARIKDKLAGDRAAAGSKASDSSPTPADARDASVPVRDGSVGASSWLPGLSSDAIVCRGG